MLNAYGYILKHFIVICQHFFCWAFFNPFKLSIGKIEGYIKKQLVLPVDSFFICPFRFIQRFLEDTNKIEVNL